MTADRVAVVTGAGAGIGRGIARRFARAGMTVVVAEFDPETGRQVAGELEALGGRGLFIETDVTQVPTVEAMIERSIAELGRVDILVNNAYPTGSLPTPIMELPEERIANAMAGGFHSAVAAMRAVQPGMKERGWGRIVNICSLNGVNAHRYTADYNSAKEALRAFTRTAAVEWARDGITANIICPGAATSAYRKMEEFAPQMISGILRLVPMGYMGDPDEDIAPVVHFLASDDARYMTGNTLFVDGGGHINGVPWVPDEP